MAHQVGGEVDGFCTRCRMVLAHTVLAMVGERIARVKCNTCSGEHAYKKSEPTATSVRASKPKASHAPRPTGARSRAQEVSFEEELSKRDPSAAKPYAVGTKFGVGDAVTHPTFGIGIVEAARSDKIDVTFKSFVKTLLHDRPTGQAPRPSFARPTPPPPADTGDAAGDSETATQPESSA
jgi:hypothetical protein